VATAVWINLAMLPCLLFAADGPACPGCPPDAAMAVHGSVHGHAADHGHGGHEQAQPERDADCGHGAQDCCGDVRIAPDDRAQKPAQPGKADFAAAGPASLVAEQRLEAPRKAFATGPPGPYTAPRRLHILNCVYLD
jgi:hypothetical protein